MADSRADGRAPVDTPRSPAESRAMPTPEPAPDHAEAPVAPEPAAGAQEAGPRGWKRVVFRLIVMLPLLLLLVLLGAFVVRLLQVRAVDEEQLVRTLHEILTHKQGEPFEVERRDGVPGFRYPDDHFVPLTPAQSDRVIYAFGGSSLVDPTRGSFPEMLRTLAREQGTPLHVYNLGHQGFDTYSVRNRVEKMLAYRKPHLVLIYSGHNDYTYVYFDVVMPEFYLVYESPVLEPLLRLAHGAWAGARGMRGMDLAADYHRFWMANLEPALLRAVQRAGLLRPSRRLFSRVNAAAVGTYRRNMEAMLAASRRAGVPVLLVTPVFNLHYPPVGVEGDAEALYARGLAQKAHGPRVALLRRAKDADVFSGMIRAKTPLLDYIRSLHGTPGVSVLDLERVLLDRERELDDDAFRDAVHIRPELHREIAAVLWDHITRHRLLSDSD